MRKTIVFFIASISIFLSQNTMAGFRIPIVSDVVDKAVDVAKDVAKVTVPTQAAIDVVRGKKTPDEAITGIMNDAQTAATGTGEVVQMVNQVTRDVTNIPDQTFEKLAESIGGDVGKVIYQIGTGPNRLVREFGFTSVDAGAAILQGRDPAIIIAMPLAAAIRDARNKHIDAALPLPDDIKKVLTPIIPRHVLDRARYTVGSVKMSLPGIIDKFGDQDAVTLDDVIVFFQEPELQNASQIELLAHELYHVYQYSEWGVDLFAYRYLINHGKVEAEAEQAGGYAKNYWQKINSNNAMVQPAMSFAGVKNSLSAPVNINTPFGPLAINRPVAQNNMAATVGGGSFTDRCVVQGEYVVVTSSNQVMSISQNGMLVGRRFPPSVPGCVFEMQGLTGQRFCVGNQSAGFVYTPGYNGPVGQCQPCLNESCFY
ncbi:DUF4157 domain-containing protein [Pararhizobium sp. IMCC21322]|uniref:eCIS core domain-containing protein n=1 Tax=Pararhizobium sp. IMCC21322 TaxID=3067903 RepID=UPI002741F8E6|nr:DUF4157 domain-containing protein [Pararhizobium sp. IMCC21322]